MERRYFLKVALGFAAGAATVATTVRAQAAPLPPMPVGKTSLPQAEPAIASQDEIDRLQPEQVRWRRRGGWRRRYWRPRFYGRRRLFRRRYWRRRWF